ncbi:hypothetical protein EYF80_031307 [Liparis tanakae]|uniref:Uncharacterized protein n=1 Tax=Liparis tanakae TaxID=230148 RepID=A0A4Z2H0Z2_9TELE|nr:hypothetical protein EYF80_031307 [Liparis tanakae]
MGRRVEPGHGELGRTSTDRQVFVLCTDGATEPVVVTVVTTASRKRRWAKRDEIRGLCCGLLLWRCLCAIPSAGVQAPLTQAVVASGGVEDVGLELGADGLIAGQGHVNTAEAPKHTRTPEPPQSQRPAGFFFVSAAFCFLSVCWPRPPRPSCFPFPFPFALPLVVKELSDEFRERIL